MPYKVPKSKVRARMDREVAAMRAQVTQLQHEHSRLLFQHSLLAAICDSLAWLRSSNQHTGSAPGLSPGAITAEEQLLLEQLAGLSCCSATMQDGAKLAAAAGAGNAAIGIHAPTLGNSNVAASPLSDDAAAEAGTPLSGCRRSSGDISSSDGDCSSDSSTVFQQQELPAAEADDTIASNGDLMQLFRRLLSMPSTAHEHITLKHLQEDYATIVCELSLNLVMLEQPQHLQAACSAEAPAAAIERLVLRHVHQMVTLLLTQRHDLLQAFYLSNCLSGAVGVERQKEAITAAVHQLQLSTQQVQQISQATAVFKRLLAPLIQGRQKLQCTGFTAASAAAATQMPGLKLEGGGVSRAVFPQQAAVLQRLQQQQRKVASLSTMMKKEMLIKGCLSVFTLGRLTWLQAARLLIHAFPYPAALAAVCQEIAELANEELQAQQAAAEAAGAAAGAVGGSGSSRRGVFKQGMRRGRGKGRRV